MSVFGDDEEAWEENQYKEEEMEDLKRENRKMKSLLHSCLLSINQYPNQKLNSIVGYESTHQLATEINRTIKP